MNGTLPLWMQVVSAVATWLGAISVVVAVLTFRFSGPWVRLRGEVDRAGNVRLLATNAGRITGHLSSLKVGTLHRRGVRLRRNAAVPVQPAITVEDFQATELEPGQLRIWKATWPESGVRVARSRFGVVNHRPVLPGSRALRVYGTVNGKFRTGRITYDKDATFE